MGISEQLAALVGELANPQEVFAVSGERTGTALAEHVHALAAVGERAWEDHIDSRRAALSVAEVEAALGPVSGDAAERKLAALASGSMVYTCKILEPRRAGHLAGQVVALLGEGAEWWCNHEPGIEGDDHLSWTSVTRCTFDGVVAGRNATHFVVLLQLGED
jgi:hypothetical protein